MAATKYAAHLCSRRGPTKWGTWEQPMTVYGKEQSLRKGDAGELKFGEEQGGIGSASAAHEVARPCIFARPVIAARNSLGGRRGAARAKPRRLLLSISFFSQNCLSPK